MPIRDYSIHESFEGVKTWVIFMQILIQYALVDLLGEASRLVGVVR
jgi:hypothetical protein